MCKKWSVMGYKGLELGYDRSLNKPYINHRWNGASDLWSIFIEFLGWPLRHADFLESFHGSAAEKPPNYESHMLQSCEAFEVWLQSPWALLFSLLMQPWLLLTVNEWTWSDTLQTFSCNTVTWRVVLITHKYINLLIMSAVSVTIQWPSII